MTAAERAQLDRLFARWRKHGDERAREQIVRQFMPLAISLVKRYRHTTEPVEDLVQVAALALVKAVDGFDTERGLPFTAYAIPTILGELRRYFRDAGWAIHVPRETKELARAVSCAEEQIATETGRSPTAQRIAEFLEIDVTQVLEGLRASRAYATVPLEAPPEDHDNPGAERRTFGAEDPGYEVAERRLMLARALRQIPAQEHELLRLRFEQELTQAEIGARLGVSQMQVSRLLRRCFDRLERVIDGGRAHGQVSEAASGGAGAARQSPPDGIRVTEPRPSSMSMRAPR